MRIKQIEKKIEFCEDKKRYFNDKYEKKKERLQQLKDIVILNINQTYSFKESLKKSKILYSRYLEVQYSTSENLWKIYKMLSDSKHIFNIKYGEKKTITGSIFRNHYLIVLKRNSINYSYIESQANEVTNVEKRARAISENTFSELMKIKDKKLIKEIVKNGKDTNTKKFLSSIFKTKTIEKETRLGELINMVNSYQASTNLAIYFDSHSSNKLKKLVDSFENRIEFIEKKNNEIVEINRKMFDNLEFLRNLENI
jgi:hypothetical protein